MKTAVFYADILGFSISATEPGAARALGQLSDVAHILSTEDSLAKYLQREIWNARYGLSDSIFLLSRDAADGCLAAAEFFFNLAYYNATEELPVLMRGSITFGEVRKTRPIFPETGKGNVVGEAVGRAVQLERSRPKGPRLLVSAEVAKALKKNSARKHLLDTHSETNEFALAASRGSCARRRPPYRRCCGSGMPPRLKDTTDERCVAAFSSLCRSRNSVDSASETIQSRGGSYRSPQVFHRCLP
jgi:hypothetical protein